MRRLILLILMLAAGLAAPARGGTVRSEKIDSVSVTVYRAPARGKGPINRNWPRGYALIHEIRTVDLPQGESVVRFEGVAEGLLPETAVLSGMPGGVREKNRDARLLSPGGLVDAYLKRSVTLRRTDRATGKVTEQDAIISAGPTGGVIVQTAQGYEALGCSGLPERMLYKEVPADLSPRPTLSAIIRSDRAQKARVELTYLAEGFDWSANYVADRGGEPGRMDLMAWLTVANGGVTGFPDAQLNVIAGQPNRAPRAFDTRAEIKPLHLQCWPMDITSTHPAWGLVPPPAMPEPMMADGAQEIMVTAQRASRAYAIAPAPPPPPAPVMAVQEDVGDLKFYRVPVRVDISAQAQKQVTLLRQSGVKVETLYAADFYYVAGQTRPMTLRLRVRNRKEDGLGLPLPSGSAAVFEQVGDARLYVGEADIGDKAVGERVDYDIGQSNDVRIASRRIAASKKRADWTVEVSNARPFPVIAEIPLLPDIIPEPEGMERRGDNWILRLDVPANGKAAYNFTQKLRP